MTLTWAWFSAFVVTQAVEVPVYNYALQRAGPERPLWTRLVLAFLASMITHPVVWFVIPDMVRPTSYAAFVAVAENFAVLVEALFMSLFGLRRAVWWALLANAASVVIGFSLRAVFGWP